MNLSIKMPFLITKITDTNIKLRLSVDHTICEKGVYEIINHWITNSHVIGLC